MEETFEILKGTKAPHREPTPEAAEAYAAFIVKAAPRPMSERLQVAQQFGWKTEEVKDEIFYREYQEKRATILFPECAKDIASRANSLIIPEVDRAEANFTKLTGIALNEPSLSLSELGKLLTQLTLTANKVDLSLTDSREQGQDGEAAP